MLSKALEADILIITRVQQLPFKAIMNDMTEMGTLSLGYLGNLEITRGLIVSLNNIFGTEIGDNYKILYTPAIIPFIVTVLICIPIFKVKKADVKDIFVVSAQQAKSPFFALVGALIMVKIMLLGDATSMVNTIGNGFSAATGEYWTYFASFLGAIGAFFSGSCTVSNLTFGGAQLATATNAGLPVVLILALQSIGGAMGNMVCINNIVAVGTVLNLHNQEGPIIKCTIIPMMVYGILAAIIAGVYLAIM